MFIQGPDGHYYHQGSDGTNWYPSLNTWEDRGFPSGAPFIGPPQVVSWGPNRLDIFGLGADSHYYHQSYDGANWSGWEDHGEAGNSVPFIGSPVVTSWGPNRLDVLGIGNDGAAYHQAWNGSAWVPSMTTYEYHSGTFASTPAARSWGLNRYDFFGPSSGDNQLYHQAFDGTNWYPSMTSYEPHGGGIQ